MIPASTIALPTHQPAVPGLLLQQDVRYQQSPDELVRATLAAGEGQLSDTGALVIGTGAFTGRSPKDKFIVRDGLTQEIHWNHFNQPLGARHYTIIRDRIVAYLNGVKRIWVRDAHAGADPRFRLNIRVICEKPWSDLFAHNMFIRPGEERLDRFVPQWTILCAPGCQLDPASCGVRSAHAAVINFSEKTILIAGTGYTGEIKKGVFTVLNYLLPQQRDVLSMHCSANVGAAGDTALFFGLSGTGKTTLSADPARKLIGDDEHGWSRHHIFNFEGGCYAKVIGLSEENEPEIFHAIRPGALVENTVFENGSNRIAFANSAITENTRVSYPLSFINNAVEPSIGGIPEHIFFLTCDANGVLPPLSQLNEAQAMYQFISGYTAKVAGTETGITEPISTFSACFGAPFLPLHPGRYAAMLGERMKRHHVKVWMVNTGWTGGAYGTGSRIRLAHTRAMINAVLKGELDNKPFFRDTVFGFQVPLACPGVPSALLQPRNTWTDPAAYDRQAKKLALQFIDNFQQYADGVEARVLAAAPAV